MVDGVAGRVGRLLEVNPIARVGEILAVFAVATVIIAVGLPFVGENALAFQGVVWVANVFMILTVWAGLRLRGQTWQHFGLSLRIPTRKEIARASWQSVAVLVVATLAFVLGGIVGGGLFGITEPVDMSGYNFLQGNLPLLILSLLGVYIVSSFGEEAVYRAFLINRIAEMGHGGKRAWVVAVLISSIVFGLVHYAWGPAGIVQTTFMGFALAVAYLLVGRNLWVTILTHLYMDTLLLVPLYFAEGPPPIP